MSPRAVAAACAQDARRGDKAGDPPAGAVVAQIYKLRVLAAARAKIIHSFPIVSSTKYSSIPRRAAARAKATVGRECEQYDKRLSM